MVTSSSIITHQSRGSWALRFRLVMGVGFIGYKRGQQPIVIMGGISQCPEIDRESSIVKYG